MATNQKPEPEPIEVVLDRLVRDHPLDIKTLASEAGVRYQPLLLWITGRQKTYSVVEAETLYTFLTGRKFHVQ